MLGIDKGRDTVQTNRGDREEEEEKTREGEGEK